MEGIFIFKAQRQRNSLEYVPYYNADNQNENYQVVNIEKVIKKLGSQKISDIVCQNNLSNDFVRSALGLTEADLYEDEEDTITLSKHDKGVDILIIWTDTKQQEPNAKKRFQSIRGIAGIYVGHDKKGIKHSKVSILCNAIASKVKTRKENLKKRGKQILQLIELLSRENNCEYITLDALDNVITYYHLFGYKLVNHPFTAERTSTTDYVKRLGVVVEKIRKVQERKSTRSDRKKNRMKDLMALLKEKRTIKEKLKRYMIGLYDVKERANFKYDYTPDTYAETGMDFVDELEEDGYKMYKSLRNNTATASSTRKKNKKGKKKTRKGGGKKNKKGKKKTRKGGSAMAAAAEEPCPSEPLDILVGAVLSQEDELKKHWSKFPVELKFKKEHNVLTPTQRIRIVEIIKKTLEPGIDFNSLSDVSLSRDIKQAIENIHNYDEKDRTIIEYAKHVYLFNLLQKIQQEYVTIMHILTPMSATKVPVLEDEVMRFCQMSVEKKQKYIQNLLIKWGAIISINRTQLADYNATANAIINFHNLRQALPPPKGWSIYNDDNDGTWYYNTEHNYEQSNYPLMDAVLLNQSIAKEGGEINFKNNKINVKPTARLFNEITNVMESDHEYLSGSDTRIRSTLSTEENQHTEDIKNLIMLAEVAIRLQNEQVLKKQKI